MRQFERETVFEKFKRNISFPDTYQLHGVRVARWHIFMPKIPIWEGLGTENIAILNNLR
jgi:hypothetical protein